MCGAFQLVVGGDLDGDRIGHLPRLGGVVPFGLADERRAGRLDRFERVRDLADGLGGGRVSGEVDGEEPGRGVLVLPRRPGRQEVGA
jgi:hypothetical protein